MYHHTVIQKLRQSLKQRGGLVKAGDRLGVAVSGGADSVALLSALAELGGELGLVFSVVHFHHGIRGTEADQDAEFVAGLAARHGFRFHLERGDVPQHAKQQHLSLETAARRMRYAYFESLVTGRVLDKIATAHTRDDQAETVLMRVVRGTGNQGLAGIAACQGLGERGTLIRPMLEITRPEVEAFLKQIGQPWREDATNRDPKHFRNRVRHTLLPLLEKDFNPSIKRALAGTAEIARAEEDYWQQEVARLLPLLLLPGRSGRSGREVGGSAHAPAGFDAEVLLRQPLAVQRRLVRAAIHTIADGMALDFHHVEDVLALARSRSKGSCDLPRGWRAVRTPRELRFETAALAIEGLPYEYPLLVPGEIHIPEAGCIVRARIATGAGPPLTLTIRNWHPGDRFQPPGSNSEKKVKELIQRAPVARDLPQPHRKAWPVAVSGGKIVWVRGYAASSPGIALVIEAENCDDPKAEAAENGA